MLELGLERTKLEKAMKEINEIRDQNEFSIYGIRIDDFDYNVDDVCYNSHNWFQDDLGLGYIFNEEMRMFDGGELNGTCSLELLDEWQSGDNLEEILTEVAPYYLGDHIYLIGGYDYEYGNDVGEVVIECAKVLYKIK